MFPEYVVKVYGSNLTLLAEQDLFSFSDMHWHMFPKAQGSTALTLSEPFPLIISGKEDTHKMVRGAPINECFIKARLVWGDQSDAVLCPGWRAVSEAGIPHDVCSARSRSGGGNTPRSAGEGHRRIREQTVVDWC